MIATVRSVVTGLIDYRCAAWQDVMPAYAGQADLVICDPMYEDSDLSYVAAAAACLRPGGSLYVFGDFHRIAETKIELDAQPHLRFCNWLIMGPQDWGGRPRDRFGQKHDDLLFYRDTRAPATFNARDVGVPKATAASAAFNPSGRDWKIPHSVWSDISALVTTASERVRVDGKAVAFQKPERVIERIVRASSNEGDLVLDFFSGVATVPAVCARSARRCVAAEIDPARHAAGTSRLAAAIAR